MKVVYNCGASKNRSLSGMTAGEVFTVSDPSRFPDTYMAYIPMSGIGKLAISLKTFKRVDIPSVYTCTPVQSAVLDITF